MCECVCTVSWGTCRLASAAALAIFSNNAAAIERCVCCVYWHVVMCIGVRSNRRCMPAHCMYNSDNHLL